MGKHLGHVKVIYTVYRGIWDLDESGETYLGYTKCAQYIFDLADWLCTQ